MRIPELIRKRYFRKVIAYPKGAVVHHGDCMVYSIHICTCGLLADLGWSTVPGKIEPEKIYPDYYKEKAIQSRIRNQVLEMIMNKKINIKERKLTKKQEKEMDNWIRKHTRK
jgi:hypothetical protein